MGLYSESLTCNQSRCVLIGSDLIPGTGTSVLLLDSDGSPRAKSSAPFSQSDRYAITALSSGFAICWRLGDAVNVAMIDHYGRFTQIARLPNTGITSATVAPHPTGLLVAWTTTRTASVAVLSTAGAVYATKQIASFDEVCWADIVAGFNGATYLFAVRKLPPLCRNDRAWRGTEAPTPLPQRQGRDKPRSASFVSLQTERRSPKRLCAE